LYIYEVTESVKLAVSSADFVGIRLSPPLPSLAHFCGGGNDASLDAAQARTRGLAQPGRGKETSR